MANTKDLALKPNPSILIVGDSGTHKTHFLGAVPGNFIYDFDDGLAVLRGQDVEYDRFTDAPHGSKRFDPKKGIFAWGKGYPAFLNHLNKLGELIDKGEGPRAISFDSLTLLSQLMMNYAMLDEGKDKTKPEIQHWGAQMELMKTVMKQMTSWPITFICTAHIQRDVNGLTQQTEMLPLLTGKLAGMIGIYFDEVWFAQPPGGTPKVYKIKTESSSIMRQAKSRYNIPNDTETSWAAVKKYFEAAPAKA